MRILTLLVYILIGLLVAWFASQNWDRTALWLPGGYEAYWPLGVYIIVALLIGLVPMAILYSAMRWRLRRKVRKLEQKLGTATAELEAKAAPAAPAMSPAEAPQTPSTPAL
ncbi:MAG: LapA family protein [Pacificimonas sp.]|jgi:uncharacterized integral membrane protein|nr:LapA family protein [Pacificimonas sp.]